MAELPGAMPMAEPGGPPPGAMPPPPSGPTGPATTPPGTAGTRQRGMILVSALGMKILEQALPMLGAETEEGRAVLKALGALAAKFGAASGDLGQAEMKLMGESMPGMGQPSPGMPEAIRQQLGSRGLGGGAPSGPMASAA